MKNIKFISYPLKRNFYRPLMVMALICMVTSGIQAQENVSPWVGEPLPEQDGEYYLYNTEGEGFLIGAHEWGANASLGQPGLLCTIVVRNGKYSIRTGAKSETADGRDHYLGSDCQVDGNNPDEWIFEDTNPDDGIHRFTLTSSQKRLYYDGTKVPLNRDMNKEPEAQWILVSKQQRINALSQATKDQCVDASFYIVGANINYKMPTQWKEEHTGGTLALIGPGHASGNKNYCTEAYNNDNFDVYQVMTGLKNGRYRVSCQGYYRPGVNVNANGAQNAFLYANESEAPLMLLYDDGNGVPNSHQTAANAFLAGRYAGNSVDVVVVNGTLRIGIKKDKRIDRDWVAFDNFRLTYYGEVEDSEFYLAVLQQLASVISNYEAWGTKQIYQDLQEVYDTYKDVSVEEYETAITAINTAVASANAIEGNVKQLLTAIKTAEDFQTNVESKKLYLCDGWKSKLTAGLEEAQKALVETGLEVAVVTIPEQEQKLNSLVSGAEYWLGMTYTLLKAKELAIRLDLPESKEEYKTVIEELNIENLTFDKVMADVKALNAVCRQAMTVEFLSAASEASAIDFTSFITNPNIYQAQADVKTDPDGWVIARLAENNSPNRTVKAPGDTELYAGSWSCNASNNVGNAWYYTQIGGREDDGVCLPDGKYKLKAATYCSNQADRMNLYGSLDNVEVKLSDFNGDKAKYEAAAGINDGSTTELTMDVSGGVLYLGLKGGEGIIGGNGQYLNADNFRLYYIGAPLSSSVEIKLSDVGMATYYSANAFTVPEGLKAGVVTEVTEDKTQLIVDWRYAAGSTVPGLTGVLLKGAEGNYNAVYSIENVARPSDNLLNGTVESKTVSTEGFKYYKLANGPSGLGFYYATEDGTSIANGANKGYLALPTEVAAKVNYFSFDLDATGIDMASETKEYVDVYSLSGVLVRNQVETRKALNGLAKGVYIVNGKKIIK